MKGVAFGVLAGLAMAALAGCSTTVQLDLDKGMLVAEAGADGVNHSAIVAAPLLHGAQATQVKACVDGTNNAVSAAHGLVVKGDLSGAVGSLNTAFTNIANCTTATKTVTGGVP